MIELPKLPEEIKENSSDIELWAKFISAERKEELEMIATKNSYIASAYEQLQIISQDKEKRLEYEAREKAIRDYNQSMKEARETGWEAGREEGEKIGERKGENRINKLHSLLLQNRRYDDLERATKDYEFQKQLMRDCQYLFTPFPITLYYSIVLSLCKVIVES